MSEDENNGEGRNGGLRGLWALLKLNSDWLIYLAIVAAALALGAVLITFI